jgi:hypothetical protein
MDRTEKTIIVGNIEFFNRSALIHSVDEVYRVGSAEEQDAIEDMLDEQNADWLIVQDYLGVIQLETNCLLKLLGCIRGE